jgi:hypothetical protein
MSIAWGDEESIQNFGVGNYRRKETAIFILVAVRT